MIKDIFNKINEKLLSSNDGDKFQEKFVPIGKIPKQDISKRVVYKNKIYFHNESGYRCENFDFEAEYKIISIGCDFVYGLGLDPEYLFHNILKEKIENKIGKKTVNWNLGIKGKSNDYIGRMLTLVVPILRPNLVLINFSDLPRREYFDSLGRCYDFDPTLRKPIREYHKNLLNLSNFGDDIINFYKNYKLMELSCQLYESDFLYSQPKNSKQLMEIKHFSAKNYVGEVIHEDFASDNSHPGKLSHKLLADNYWEKLIENKYLEKHL